MKINGMTRERGIIKQGLRLLNILIFLWSFSCEKTIFYVGMITETRRLVMYILIKLMLISLLVIENRVLMHIIDTFREKETKFCCCFFGLLVAVYSLFFCLIYPGVWNYDAIGIVHVVRDYGTEIISQGIITNLFVGAVLSILPYASAVVFFQCIIDLGITSYIASEIYRITEKKYICMILFIMELLPLSIITNMIIMRMSLFGHLMILLMYCVWNECYIKKEDELSRKAAIGIGILSGIVSTFRFEASFVWIFIVLLFFIVKRKCVIGKMVLLLCAMGSYLIIGNVRSGLQESRAKSDIAIAMCTSLSLMLQYDLRGDIDNWTDDIDTLMDTEIVRQYPSSWSPGEAWRQGKRERNVLEMDMTDVLIAYGKLVFSNFDVYLKTKYEQFKVVHSWDEIGYDSVNEAILNSIYGVTIMGDGIQNREIDLYRMPFSNIRIKLLKRIYNLTGNVSLDNILLGIIPALFFMLGSFICSIRKKDIVLFFLAGTCICKFICLMAGMATSWPIYFGPVILEGGALITIAVSSIVYKREKSGQDILPIQGDV